jgi:hypothetical protein
MKKDKLDAYPEVEPGVTGPDQTAYDPDADVFGNESNAQVSCTTCTARSLRTN